MQGRGCGAGAASDSRDASAGPEQGRGGGGTSCPPSSLHGRCGRRRPCLRQRHVRGAQINGGNDAVSSDALAALIFFDHAAAGTRHTCALFFPSRRTAPPSSRQSQDSRSHRRWRCHLSFPVSFFSRDGGAIRGGPGTRNAQRDSNRPRPRTPALFPPRRRRRWRGPAFGAGEDGRGCPARRSIRPRLACNEQLVAWTLGRFRHGCQRDS